jgi:hypothetical protein
MRQVHGTPEQDEDVGPIRRSISRKEMGEEEGVHGRATGVERWKGPKWHGRVFERHFVAVPAEQGVYPR